MTARRGGRGLCSVQLCIRTGIETSFKRNIFMTQKKIVLNRLKNYDAQHKTTTYKA